jgi:hypothetical protein
MSEKHVVIDFPINPTVPQKEVVLKDYLGLWVGGVCGNLPAMIFDPEVADKAKEIADAFWPENYIFASIKLPERKLITRKTTQGIKQFAVNILTKLSSQTEEPVEEPILAIAETSTTSASDVS